MALVLGGSLLAVTELKSPLAIVPVTDAGTRRLVMIMYRNSVKSMNIEREIRPLKVRQPGQVTAACGGRTA